LYILLRRPDDLNAATSTSNADAEPSTGTATVVPITYTPMPSPVRSKTLFASTRLTLVRDLGGEHFLPSLFVTDAEELTQEGWKKHEAHEDLAQPLTREEEDLVGIKEAEAREAGGTGGRRGHVHAGLNVGVGEGVVEALRQLGSGSGGNLVQLVSNIFF
jgi:twinfilin